MFDGSSIAGWKAINESDMMLMPDPTRRPSIRSSRTRRCRSSATCSSRRPASPTAATRARSPRRPRPISKQTGIGDTVYFGPEAEFFVFDDVRYSATPYNTGFKLDAIELPTNSDTEYEMGNLGHRSAPRGGYFPVPPIDSLQDMRSEMLSAMASMGVKVEKHHHEVASAQHELGMKFGTLVTHGRPHADLQILHPQRRPRLRQDGDLHAEADLWRQRLGHARAPVDLEGRQAALRRQPLCRPVGEVPLLHRRHHQARQGAQRLHQPARPTPTSAWSRASRRRCCSPIRRATARPRAASRSPTIRRPSASRSASPIPAPTPISPSRRC